MTTPSQGLRTTERPVNFPPKFDPTPVNVPLPVNACDTHFHVWGPPQTFPYASHRTYTPPACPIEHYMAIAEKLGIQRAVLVQSNIHEGDIASSLDALEKFPDRLRGVIKYDPTLTTQELRALDRRGFRGFRLNFLEHLHGRYDSATLREASRTAAELDWNVALHLDAATLRRVAGDLVSAPCKLTIDHLGDSRDLRGIEGETVPTLEELLGHDHVWVKASALDRRLRAGTDYGELVTLMQHLLKLRPDRILWGSDWPHSGHFALGSLPDDGKLLNMWSDFTDDDAVRHQVFAANPEALYRF